MSSHQKMPRKKPRPHSPLTYTAFITCIPFTSSSSISLRHLQNANRCTISLNRSTFLSRPCLHSFHNNNNHHHHHHHVSSIQMTNAASEQVRENLTNVSDSVIRAVEQLSRQPRQTVADIAATAGISLNEATDEAVKLAALTNASIDVSESGDIAYRFPSDIRNILRNRSLLISINMTWKKIAPTLYTFSRITFGALLFISIIVTFIGITALSAASSSSSSSRDDDRNRNRSLFFSPRFFFGPDIFDVMFYSNYYNRNRYGYENNNKEMSFLEAVYSFVFGDGNPNNNFEENQWKIIANIIRYNRGAVTIDQLAPFLNPPIENNLNKESNIVDENYILPALTKFGGHPEVTDDGDIIYVFPSFMTTGGKQIIEPIGLNMYNAILEKEEELTRANASQKFFVISLGIVNILGVLVLGTKLATAIAVTKDAAQLIAFFKGIYPALCAYATSFVAAPIIRWFNMKRKNKQITIRNQARLQKSRYLKQRNEDVRRKLNAAERFIVKSNTVTNDDVIYSSDREIIDQTKQQDDLKDDFDRRLNSS